MPLVICLFPDLFMTPRVHYLHNEGVVLMFIFDLVYTSARSKISIGTNLHYEGMRAYALSNFDARQTEKRRSPISSRLFQNYPDSKFVENFLFSVLSVSE